MVKHMKRRRRPARASAKKTQPRGFDYGCLPYAMALASFEFPQHLSAAAVDGVIRVAGDFTQLNSTSDEAFQSQQSSSTERYSRRSRSRGP